MNREAVNAVLESYAKRRVFRGLTRESGRNNTVTFKIAWHHNRVFDLVLNTRTNTLKFPLLLPNVPAQSSMYREFREFLKSYHSEALPSHRRIDKDKARLSCRNLNGQIAVTIQMKDQDYEYATRKLIHVAQEIFLVFLFDGPYHEYRVETLNLDPDFI
jgi:hypothetical protein